jgi:hypothetical protein
MSDRSPYERPKLKNPMRPPDGHMPYGHWSAGGPCNFRDGAGVGHKPALVPPSLDQVLLRLNQSVWSSRMMQ